MSCIQGIIVWSNFIISRILARHVPLPAVGARQEAIASTLFLAAWAARERWAVPSVNDDDGVTSAVALHPLLSSYYDEGSSMCDGLCSFVEMMSARFA